MAEAVTPLTAATPLFAEDRLLVGIADVKGDLAGMAVAGDNPKMQARAEGLGISGFAFEALAVGEALVSMLLEDGSPSMVARTKIRPPFTRLGAISADERKAAMHADIIGDTYDEAVNRESAYEKLSGRAERFATKTKTAAPRCRPPQGLAEQIAKAAVRSASSSIGRQIGSQIMRGTLGGLRH